MHNLIFRSAAGPTASCRCGFFEFGTVYRYEKSGVVHGLTRVRGLTQDDAHIYCTPEQVPDEIRHLLRFVLGLLRDFGLDDFYLELSTRDNESDKFIGSDEQWEVATAVLEEVAERVRAGAGARPGRRGVLRPEDLRAGPGRDRPHLADVDHPVRLQPAGAVRAGVQRRRRHPAAAGDDPLGEVRLDRAVLRGAHRALRRRVPGLAVAGAGGRHPGRRRLRRPPGGRRPKQLRAKGIRAEVDHSDDRMQKKIRTHTTGKVPFLLLAGAKDVEAGAVSFRFRDGTQVNGVPVGRRRSTRSTAGSRAGRTPRRPRRAFADLVPPGSAVDAGR